MALGMPLAEIEDFLDYLDATNKPAETPLSLSLRAAPSDVPTTTAIGTRVEEIRLTGTLRAAVYAALTASLFLAATLGSIWLYSNLMQPIYVAEICGSADARWLEEGMPEADGRLPAGRRLVLATGLAEIAFASGAM